MNQMYPRSVSHHIARQVAAATASVATIVAPVGVITIATKEITIVAASRVPTSDHNVAAMPSTRRPQTRRPRPMIHHETCMAVSL